MLYSIQNQFGEVYGIFEDPQALPNLTPDEFAEALKEDLADDPVIRKIRSAPLPTRNDLNETVFEDRVVITIDGMRVGYDLSKIHTAVGMVSVKHELGEE